MYLRVEGLINPLPISLTEMKTDRRQAEPKHVKHVVPSERRRNERHLQNQLRHADQVDWDEEDCSSRETRYRTRQAIE